MTCTFSQESCSLANARSINHGVRPPLTATMKRPRAAIAARASAAIIAAAVRATPSSSGWTSIFMRPIPVRGHSGSDWKTLIALGRSRLAVSWLLSALGFLQMSTEFITHGRQQLVAEIRLAARAETFVEGGRKYGRRHGLVDRGLDRPAPFAGVGDFASKVGELGIFRQRGCSEVEQP